MTSFSNLFEPSNSSQKLVSLTNLCKYQGRTGERLKGQVDLSMLKNTFLHVPGVGPKTETKLWERHIFSWTEFLKNERKVPGLSRNGMDKIAEYLLDSMEAVKRNNVDFFAESLPRREWWRLYSAFRGSAVFLDIETTGLSRYYDEVTLIGLFDGKDVKIFVKGQNLDDFLDEIGKYSMIVTFNGTLFDLPFLASKFESLKSPRVHVDLRFFLRRLGYKGGLKSIEKRFGVLRDEEVQPIDGFGATVLWNRYLRGNFDALRLLVEYNIADTINLKTLMEKACHMMEKTLLWRSRTSHYDSRLVKKPLVDVLKKDESSVSLIVDGNHPIPIDLKVNEIGRIHIDLLLSKFDSGNYPRVVGLDLSASEKRRTGWALLEGRFVKTRLLKTNKEIIDATVKAKPDLVSIDSPLSLPKGRDCTSDSCECRRFGITRECERVLRSRGIFIFPCLIRSMQALTERGIRLKKEFENLGFSVIESYPGVAQDILRIIRKKVSVEELKQGLVDFGLVGDFVNGKSTHDELDAITSALVGYFYSTEDYEAIGNEEEEHLIIPDFRHE